MTVAKKDYNSVSVVICCYNSELRLPKTLHALNQQIVANTVTWEVVIVDNASTDNTALVARTIWEQYENGVNMTVTTEPDPGLGNARKKGVKIASCDIILFCDDDNWLSPSYLQGIVNIFNTDSAIAACGGRGLPVFENTEPAWFKEFEEAYAVGSQKINIENNKLLALYGAGMAVRKDVLLKFYNNYNSLMKGRVGGQLSSSEDTEITYAFILMGYKLYCSDELTFYHYLPARRLTTTYLTQLFQSFGKEGPVRNLYYAFVSERKIHKQLTIWEFHVLLSIIRVLKYYIKPPKKNSREIYYKWNQAYIKELFAIRKTYPVIKKNIESLIQRSNSLRG